MCVCEKGEKEMSCFVCWLCSSGIDRRHALADCLLMRGKIYNALIDGSNLGV